jgi:hypothetical protein
MTEIVILMLGSAGVAALISSIVNGVFVQRAKTLRLPVIQ